MACRQYLPGQHAVSLYSSTNQRSSSFFCSSLSNKEIVVSTRSPDENRTTVQPLLLKPKPGCRCVSPSRILVSSRRRFMLRLCCVEPFLAGSNRLESNINGFYSTRH